MKQLSERSTSNRPRSVATLIAIIAAFGTNIIANIFPFNGLTIGEISNQYFGEVLIIPANYAFAIWGIIYLGLISFAIYQVLPQQQDNHRLRRIGYLLVVASVAQIVWVVLFEYLQFAWSVLAMLVILASLIATYMRLQIGVERVSVQAKWLVNIPLSIYLAWISVATIVNIASTLYNFGWNGGFISPIAWTVVMLLAGAAIAGYVTVERTDIAFNLVFVWAYIAIAVRQAEFPAIAWTAVGLAIALAIVLVVSLQRRKTHRRS